MLTHTRLKSLPSAATAAALLTLLTELATLPACLIQLRYQNITRKGIPQRLPLRCGHCENLMEISQRLERAKHQEVNLAVRKWLLAVCADVVLRGCVSEPGGRTDGVEFMAD